MKIAFLTREYPPHSSWGGEAVAYHNLATALSGLGNEVHVICQAQGHPVDTMIDGVHVHGVGTNPERYSVIARINYSYHAWRKLKAITSEHKIDIIAVPYWSAEGLLFALSGWRTLVVHTTSSPRDAIRTRNYSGMGHLVSLRVLAYLADFTARRAAKIIADSAANRDQVIREVHVKPDKVSVVHLAVDLNAFKPVRSDFRQKLDMPAGAPLVLSVGRLEARKGTHILVQAIVKAAELMPEARFVMVGRDTNTAPGGGSFRSWIEEKAKAHFFRDRLAFFDTLPEDELVQLYSTCSVFVFPSLRESFGLPVIEAMSCGRPVVATPVGIVPELTASRLKGLCIVPVGDTEKLAEAILRFITLPLHEQCIIAKENRRIVEALFSVEEQAKRTAKIYSNLLGNRSKVR